MAWIGKSVTMVRANSLNTSDSFCSLGIVLRRPPSARAAGSGRSAMLRLLNTRYQRRVDRRERQRARPAWPVAFGTLRSTDRGGPPLPVAVTKQALVELPRGEAGKLVLEVDGSRAFEVGQMLSAEVDELPLELRPPVPA